MIKTDEINFEKIISESLKILEQGTIKEEQYWNFLLTNYFQEIINSQHLKSNEQLDFNFEKAR
jgi:hypothetical protein